MGSLKSRWGVQSGWQLLLIFMVFAITGSASVYLANLLLFYLGIEHSLYADFWWGSTLYWILRILTIFPIYLPLLLIIAWLFGQFGYFWTLEKKLLQRMGFGRIFGRL